MLVRMTMCQVGHFHSQNVRRILTNGRYAGTSFVLDDESRPTQNADIDSRLKYDRSGPVPIILVPQPSDDPNDPLVSPATKCQNCCILTHSRTGHYGNEMLYCVSYPLYQSSPRPSVLSLQQIPLLWLFSSNETSQKWRF
jgi:hypothetical protein